MPTQVRSYSKINLGLAIGPPRPDGFHGLTTVYQTLELHDLLRVHAKPASKTAITLSTNDRRVPTDSRNTAWKMIEGALAELNLAAEVHVEIEKKLPVQGGMGAGSANAAAALIGLENELNVRLNGAKRLELASKIGSDVPLFLLGGTILGLNRGEEVYPLPDLPATWCVVASPSVGVSTPQAFRDWDARLAAQTVQNTQELTETPASDRLKRLSRSLASVFGEPHSSGVSALGGDLAENPLLALVRTGIENDFEEVVFPQHPPLGDIKRLLAASGQSEHAAIYAALSGSGSSLFGLYATEPAATLAYERLTAKGIPAFVTKTAPREKYWREMLTGN